MKRRNLYKNITEIEKKLFANELALQNLETTRHLMGLADSDAVYLQLKHNIEEAFEKHKQEYKELSKEYIEHRIR